MNILCIGLEFSTWKMARPWSYPGLCSFLDGFNALGHRVVFLPAIYGTKPGDANSWLTYAPSLLEGEVFDQAWIWITHNEFTQEFWSWFETIAPVRVGTIMESMTAEAVDVAQLPHLTQRQELVLADLSHCTHAAVVDEIDVATVENKLGIPAAWYTSAIDASFFRDEPPPEQNKAIFVGSLNNVQRKEIFANPEIHEVLERARLPENETSLPDMFEQIHVEAAEILKTGAPTRADLDWFARSLHELRQSIFELLLEGYRTGLASVNLPSYFKGYPSRVQEAMAAGVPVISWHVPNRPDCERLFEHERDILFFDADRPASLAEAICRLRDDRALASRLVRNAREKLLTRHTAEIQAAEFMRWIADGVRPDYFKSSPPLVS